MASEVNFERYQENIQQNDWLYRIIGVILCANVFLVIFNFSLLLLLIFQIPLLFILGYKLFQYVPTDNTNIPSSKNFLGIFKKHLQVNKRYIFGICIGLMFAISIFTHYSVYNTNYVNRQIGELSEQLPSHTIEYTTDEISTEDVVSAYTERLRNYNIDVLTTTIIEKIDFQSDVETYLGPTDQVTFTSEYISGSLFEYLRSFSSFDNKVDSSASILVVFPEDDGLQYKINPYNYTITNSGETLDTSFEVDYVWQPSLDDLNKMEETESLSLILNNKLLVTDNNQDKLSDFVENLSTNNSNEFSLYPYLDPQDLTSYSQTQLVDILKEIRGQTTGDLSSADINIDEMKSLEIRLQVLTNQVSSFQTTMLIQYLPLLGLAGYLIYFSSGIANEKKRDFFTKLKSRGITGSQIIILLVLEFIPIVLISSLLSGVLSVTWLAFDVGVGNIPETTSVADLHVPTNLLWRGPILAISLLYLLTINDIRALARLSPDDSQNIAEKGLQLVQKTNLDLILFFASLLFSLLIRIDLERIIPSYGHLIRNSFSYITTMNYILIFTASLVVMRLLLDFIVYISDKLSSIDHGFTRLSLVNFQKHSFSTRHLVVLIVLVTLVASSAFYIPVSVEQWSVDRSRYETGSDIRVEGYPDSIFSSMNSDKNYTFAYPSKADLTNGQDIDGISEISPYYKITTNLRFELTDGTQLIDGLTILAVDPSTLEETLNYQSVFSDREFAQIIDILKNNQTIVGQNLWDGVSNNGEDHINVGSSSFIKSFEVGRAVEQFPGVFSNRERPETIFGISYEFVADEFFVIGNLKYILEKKSTPSRSYSFLPGWFVSTDSGADDGELADIIQQQFHGIVHDIDTKDEVLDHIQSDPKQSALTSVTSSILFISILIFNFVLGYFIFLRIKDETEEIAILRTVGFSTAQIRKLELIKYSLVLAVSMGCGFIFGYVVAGNSLLDFVKSNNFGSHPELDAHLDYTSTVAFFIAILSSFLVLIVLAVRRINQVSIDDIFRGGR